MHDTTHGRQTLSISQTDYPSLARPSMRVRLSRGNIHRANGWTPETSSHTGSNDVQHP